MNKKNIIGIVAVLLVSFGLWYFGVFNRLTSKNIYRDEKRGVAFTFPGSWDNFKGREEIFNDASGVVSLTFSLPLKNQSELEDVWFVNAWPVRKWSSFDCDNEAGLCYKGPEIGRNANYVFEKGYIMTDLADRCSSDNNFYGKEMKFCNQLGDLKKFLDNWSSKSINTF